MSSEKRPQSRKAPHVLALAVTRRLLGRAIQGPTPGDADDGGPGQADDEDPILAQARSIVQEICAGSWSHLNDIAAPQRRALPRSALVDTFPRYSFSLTFAFEVWRK